MSTTTELPPGSTPLRAGVVGCGAIAQEHLAFLAGSQLAVLDAVCDRSPATASEAQSTFGASEVFGDADEMLATRRLDVVHVLTPPPSHAALITKALAAGANVVCEKPMALDADTIQSLVDTARADGLAVLESRNYLYNDPVRRIDALVSSGDLGEIREVDIDIAFDVAAGPLGDPNLRSGGGAELPGGAVHDFLPHISSMLLHFCDPDAEPSDIVGRLENLSSSDRAGTDHLDALVTVGAVRGHLRVSPDVAPDAFRLVVRGTRGSAVCDLFQPFVRVRTERMSGKRAPIEQVSSGLSLVGAGLANARNKVMQHTTYHGLQRMLEEFYSHVLAGEAPAVTGDDIVRAARLTDQVVGLRVAR